jgi:hypothetical protein
MALLQLLCLLGAWVLLPLVPAVLIYKLFPNTPVTASGPLAGLTINTGGAFAAYLIIFLIVIPLVNTTKDDIGSMMRPSWEVRGEVTLVDQNGKAIARRDLLNNMGLGSIPPVLDHSAERLILRIPQDSWGAFPKIVIDIPGWGTADVDLNKKANIDSHYSKLIDVGEIQISKRQEALLYESRSPMDK